MLSVCMLSDLATWRTDITVAILAQVYLRIVSIFPPAHSQMHGIHGFGLYSSNVLFIVYPAFLSPNLWY